MKPKHLVLILALVAIISSCKDFIEPSITNRLITLEAPGDQYQSTSYTINFWWDPVDDALTYHLQVVTPDFNTVSSLALDTVIKGTKFAINLKPGSYQWRVMAQNGSSQTKFSTPKSFTILESSIKQQSVQLISPSNNSLTNQGAVLLQWGSLYGATKYKLEIDTNSFINETSLIYNQSIPGQQFNFTFPKDKIYQWRVRAENDTAQAQWSSVNIITYDHIPPQPVSLTTPANNQQVSLPVSCQWNIAASATKYKLYAFKSDSTTTYSSTFPLSLNTSSYNFNLGSPGERIYWKVTAIDAAGNESQPSILRSFVLK
jgi:hypothetical protein